ncbi:MraY family glycosyltransferase [Spirochaeta dissipatitropha]
MHLVIAFAAAFGLNLLLTPLIIHIACRNGWYDDPDHRTVHTVPVPRLGGIGFVVSILLVCIAFVLVMNVEIAPRFWMIVVGLLIFHVVGVADDFVVFRAIIKLSGQLVAAMFLIGGGLVIDRIGIPFTDYSQSLGPLGPIITLIWIVAITNAVNLMDGLDGLAGGISLLAFLAMAVYFALQAIYPELLFLVIGIGALSAFLYYNKPKARIFMGDGGSLFLGALLAILPIMGGDSSLFHVNFLLAPTLVALPILDTLAAIWRRVRDSYPIHHPDKKHLHHKLLNMGLDNWKILKVVYMYCLILGVPVLLQGFGWTTAATIALAFAWLQLLLFFFRIHQSGKALAAEAAE